MTGSRIVLATLGTRGDVIPFIDLAVELRSRGHQPLILSNANHEVLAQQAEIPFEAVCDPEMPQVGCDPRTFVSEQLIPAAERTANRILQLAETEAPLAVVSRFGNWGAAAACEKNDIALVNILLQPDAIWEQGNPIDPPDLPLLNGFRTKLGLPPISGPGVLEDARLKLSLYPDWFGYPESRSWAAGTCVGFPAHTESASRLPDEIDHFIKKFGPPIVFALGTGMRNVDMFVEIARSLPDATGHPVLMLSPTASDTSKPVLGFQIANFVDHATLFPHAAMVLHNGGIGVTAKTIRAGKPHLVVPFVWDQPDNATRLEGLGIGRIVLPENLTAAAVEAAVRELILVNPKLLKLAQAGATMSDAIPRAVDAIESSL